VAAGAAIPLPETFMEADWLPTVAPRLIIPE
jgi:hypothetical protein